MNERIIELGQQAYDAASIWPINSKMWYEVYNAKFAETIVVDCAMASTCHSKNKVTGKYMRVAFPIPEMDVQMETAVQNRILNAFGIER